jgi:hypothetical protein
VRSLRSTSDEVNTAAWLGKHLEVEASHVEQTTERTQFLTFIHKTPRCGVRDEESGEVLTFASEHLHLEQDCGRPLAPLAAGHNQAPGMLIDQISLRFSFVPKIELSAEGISPRFTKKVDTQARLAFI